MATFTAVRNQKQTAGVLGWVLGYVSQRKKTVWEDRQLVSGCNCVARSALAEMLTTKERYQKTDGMMFYHFVQSFHPDEDVSPQEVHAIGLEPAEKLFPGYEVVVATHTDTDHLHNHLIVNSVNMESGRKLHQHTADLQRQRQVNDELCMAHGLTVLPPRRQKRSDNLSAREYRAAAKGRSWKFRLMSAIEDCMRYARSREEFIRLMESEGYQVRWEKERKYITYTTPEGQRCRDNKLHGDKFWKEMMEREFRIRAEILRGGIDGDEPSGSRAAADDRTETAADHTAATDYTAAAGPTGEPSHGAGVGGTAGSAAGSSSASGEDHTAAGQVSVPTRSETVGEAAGDAGAGTEGTAADGGEAGTGWEEERAALLQMVEQGARLQPDRGGQVGGAGADHRGSAAGGGLRRDNDTRQHPQPAPLKPLHAGLYGLAAMGGLLDDDEQDAEERYRRILAEQSAKNFGTVIGLAAGAALALTREKQESEEQQEAEEQKEQTMEQTMGGL